MREELIELLKPHGVTHIDVDRDATHKGQPSVLVAVRVAPAGRVDTFTFDKINHMTTQQMADVIKSYINKNGATQ